MAWAALHQGRVLFHCPVPVLRALPSHFPHFHQRHHTCHKLILASGTTKWLCVVYMLCGNTFSHNAYNSVLERSPGGPSIFRAGEHSHVELHRHDIMGQTDACNRQPFVTTFHLSHQVKCLSSRLSFLISAPHFLGVELSAPATEQEGGWCSKHFRHVWMEWCDEKWWPCSATVGPLQGEACNRLHIYWVVVYVIFGGRKYSPIVLSLSSAISDLAQLNQTNVMYFNVED